MDMFVVSINHQQGSSSVTHNVLTITENVELDDLVNYTYLVADDSDAEYTTIINVTPGDLYTVECSLGVLKLDPEFTVRAAR